MYSFRTTSGPVHLAFTDRFGGVSGVPYESLNLAIEGEDAAEQRAENVRLLLSDFAPDAALAQLHQVHGSVVITTAAPTADPAPEADGLVTTTPDLVLMVRAADCVPVLLADPDSGVIGAAHCGRPGLVAGVVPATIAVMRAAGAGDITAWVGPHVCGRCYEVPSELQDEVAAQVPASRATTSWGTPALDLGAGVQAQLDAADVKTIDVSRCTRESDDLYSYRRDGVRAGRLAGVIRLAS